MRLLLVAVPHSCWPRLFGARVTQSPAVGSRRPGNGVFAIAGTPIAGIYDAAALHSDLNMLESIRALYLQLHKFDCFEADERRQCFLLAKKEKAMFPVSRLHVLDEKNRGVLCPCL